ncbi:hypothetical protein VTK73DRAFT_7682 [Phialemonium thermophilum]|uniref:Uncharacterized protein n=1 Tax=Phialemonium thermophilum TaxID=223376 RepID=A0ABR3XRI8_9PEZI
MPFTDTPIHDVVDLTMSGDEEEPQNVWGQRKLQQLLERRNQFSPPRFLVKSNPSNDRPVVSDFPGSRMNTTAVTSPGPSRPSASIGPVSLQTEAPRRTEANSSENTNLWALEHQSLPPRGHQTPSQHTPQKSNWTVDQISTKLETFSLDVKKFHARLVRFLIQQTWKKFEEPKNLSSFDDFADMQSTALEPDQPLGDAMAVKFKQHNPGKDHSKARILRFPVCGIKTGAECVPRYRFHHVEIRKNILSPNTMLKFVPHLRDLDEKEEKKYFVWLKELEAMDNKSGFKTLNRVQKMAKSRHDEYAATLYTFLDRWIETLDIPGCTKSTLIRYMATQSETDDAITPQQKNTLLDSYSEDAGSPQTKEAARLFTEAFDRVFGHRVPLRDVLMLDESVETIVDNKKAKDTPSSEMASDEQLLLGVEKFLLTYSVLGCLICYSHDCEHGEFGVENQKRTFSIDSLGRFGPLLKKKWVNQIRAKQQAGISPSKQSSSLCRNQCYRSYDIGNPAATVPPWTEKQVEILKAMFTTLGHSSLRPQCTTASLLGRKCWDVYRKMKELKLSLPTVELPPELPKVKMVPWYDRTRKVLLGDWQDCTVSHEHAKREIFDPCHHDGPCSAANKCPCVLGKLLCERFCQCTAENCAYKFTGCACHSTGKTCHQRQKEGKPCICVQLNRECDPVLCKGCGAAERADPLNANDELLHSTGCQNVSLQRGVSKAVVVGKSQLEGCGYGLFTAQDIAQDEYVIEYTGELITHDEGVRREARRGNVFDEGSHSSYLFTLLEQEGIWVDAAIYGNLSRYINHASEGDKKGCNIMPKILYVNGEFRIRFTALRDIKAGEELFFNYGENFPNLTKKLLEDKEAEENDPSGATKRKAGRPPRDENARVVARKSSNRTKVKEKTGHPSKASRSRGRGRARKEAPGPSRDVGSMDWEVEVLEDGDDEDDVVPEDESPSRRTSQTGTAGRRGRRTGGVARGLMEGDDGDENEGEDDYDEYQPVNRDNRETSNGNDSFQPTSRGRRRPGRPLDAKKQALGGYDSEAIATGTGVENVKRVSRRGGARPGAGRKPKKPRQPVPTPADAITTPSVEDSDGRPILQGAASTAAPAGEPTISAAPSQFSGAGRKRKASEIETDGEGESMIEHASLDDSTGIEVYADEEDDEDDDEDDVTARVRRNRKKPLRYRADS